MRTGLMVTSALGALLLAAPAWAQNTERYGYRPPAGVPETPSNQGGVGLIPPVGAQDRAAVRAERMANTDRVQSLLQDADTALSRRNPGLANELLERAETSLLNSGPSGPRDPGLLRQIGQARQALMHRDMNGAREAVQMAMRGGGDVGAGPGGRPMPAEGGYGAGGYGPGPNAAAPYPGGSGYPPQGTSPGTAPGYAPQGSMMLRDSGPGGSSMSRADALILAQAGGGSGGGGGGSGGGGSGTGGQAGGLGGT
ncbi:MAG TPA: hypothetical protein VE684_17975, partial [Crenalkalicoccus sp.]|nr:hypothetical protein [Crenalkalicoccus sp.]